MKTVSLLIGLLWALSTFVKAQPYVAWVKHYGPENGLAHREVNAILQDRQGFMWFGTKFGLNRFDGKTFTTFTKEHSGLAFDEIRSIAEDAAGNLWLASATGQSRISIFNPLTSKAISFAELVNKLSDPAPFNNLQGLLSSDNGTIFLTNYQPARLISYHPASGLRVVSLPQFKTLGTFRATRRNTVWALADGNRLVELTSDGRILRQISHGQDTVGWCYGQHNAGIEFFYTVYNPAKTEQARFYSIDVAGRRRKWSPVLLESIKRYMMTICHPVDSTGLLWDGISLRDSTSRTILSIAGQTSGGTVENRSFYTDRNGHFWLGTSFGVYQVNLSQNHFHRLIYQENNKQEPAAIRGITVLGDQVFVNLEKSGLYSVPRQGGTPKKLYSASTFVYGLAQDGHGKLYVDDGKQLVHYNPLAGTYSTANVPNASAIWTLHPFGANQWLCGSQNGLLWINTQKGQVSLYTQYNQFTELAQSHVLYIAPDRQGTFWLCTTTGLYVVDPIKGAIARYWSGGKGKFYLPVSSFEHFHQDADGVYWLATANAGLLRWNRRQNQYRQFRRTDGLSNDNLHAVYADRRGKLWLSSDYGIMQFDPVKLTTRTYFVQDGVTHNEFNRIAHYQDQTGRLYFGGLNGITCFDPQDFENQRAAAPLPMRLVSFRQFDQARHQIVDKTEDLAKTHQIIIRPGDQTAVLEFTLLNFTNAEKNVYAYQFQGLDNGWTPQTESSIRLSNLPYGTYELRIKGQAATGQWSTNILTFQVEVQRPFYLRGWFLALIIMGFIIGIWGWLKWRIWNHQQEQKRLQTEIRQATARIEADKQLIEEQALALQQLNESKSRFFANISHEFRTPLTVILGMAEQVKQRAEEEPVSSLWRAGELIKRNGSSLLRLINQILDLSKLESGQMQVQLTRSDLVGFTHYVAESFQAISAAKGVKLQVHADMKTLEADFDQDKLQDILTNLLTNALKFTPAGGRVSLHLSTEDTDSPLEWPSYYQAVLPDRQTPGILFRIRDTGFGMETEKLPLVFDRFFQVAPQQASGLEGTGIGLALVRELITLMKGGLAVRSQPGQGTEFVVWLPQTRQAPRVSLPDSNTLIISFLPDRLEAVEPVEESNEHKPVLLVVEDHEDVATYIQTCLQADYRIVRAENGQTGVDRALEAIPDLILSDVMMAVPAGPQIDGFGLCETLKNDPRTSHIPIVLLTARATHDDRLDGLRRGADAYLTKPFRQEELRVVLDNLLQSRRVLQRYYSQLALTAPPALPVGEDTPSLEAVFLQKLRALLETQLDNADLSIEEICRQMAMGRTTLHRKLVALTGMSITRYVRTLRLAKARELLSTTSLNISEVAYAIGFEDPKYFSRVFSEEFRVSPQQFRLLAQSEQ